MDLVTKDTIRNIITNEKGMCVSLFMPTHRSMAEPLHDKIRFKNLIGQAEKHLTRAGLSGREMDAVLAPARGLLEEYRFWDYLSDGLALFASSAAFMYFRLPIAFEERVYVNEQFQLKPLLPVLTAQGRFYLLALSQNRIRLFQGTRFSIDEVPLEGIPPHMDEALKFDSGGRQMEFMNVSSAGNVSAPAGRRDGFGVFYGRGGGTEDRKDNIAQYFRIVSKGIKTILQDETIPMLLAGVDYLLPIYRQANVYARLMDEGITGNPDRLSPQDLHRQAWEIMHPFFLKDRQDAMAVYRQLAGTGKASSDLESILKAGVDGRIAILFVARNAEKWGRFDPQTLEAQFDDASMPGNEDLLNRAAIQTFLNSGTVYAVEAAEIPDASDAAAVFRW